MKPKTVLCALLVLSLLAAGLWLLMLGNSIGDGTLQPESATSTGRDFQQAFWEERPLDLVVQACLIISGALGVAALLPAKDEE